MPTVRLPEESEHSEMVRKIDSMLREITKAPAMTQSARAQGLRPSILMVTQAELAHVMASRTILDQPKRMLALAVAAVKSAPYVHRGIPWPVPARQARVSALPTRPNVCIG